MRLIGNKLINVTNTKLTFAVRKAHSLCHLTMEINVDVSYRVFNKLVNFFFI
jgi:hypothetical protein